MTGEDFIQAIEGRRSIYTICSNPVIEDEKLEEVIKKIVKTMPTAMNSQSSRVALLLGEQHNKFWEITMEQLRKRVPAERFGPTEDKINGFAAGRGTVLYFDEMEIIHELQEKYPLYKDNFPLWGQQANGMLQFAIWTGLKLEGYGASLQHYGEVVNEQVMEEWGIKPSWKLIAQMPFGEPTGQPKEKTFEPIEKRVKIFK